MSQITNSSLKKQEISGVNMIRYDNFVTRKI